MLEILNDDLLNQLVKAILNNENFNYEKEGLNIQSKSSDNSLSVEINYNNKGVKLAEKEAKDFITYLEDIDDSIFTEVCEYMGEEEVGKINDLISSSDVENVKEGIDLFKDNLRDYLEDQIEYYQDCLEKYL